MTRRLRSETILLSLLALLAGGLVYALARPDSIFALDSAASYTAWTANLPSLLHTLGFALLCAACAANRQQAAWVVLLWGGIEFAAELSQTTSTAAVPGLSLRWTFDVGDLAAIAAGVVLALFVILGHPDARIQ